MFCLSDVVYSVFVFKTKKEKNILIYFVVVENEKKNIFHLCYNMKNNKSKLQSANQI